MFGLIITIVVIFMVLMIPRMIGSGMIVLVNDKTAFAKAIEWTDRLKSTPIAFRVTCPHCLKEQWFQKSTLYIAHDNSKNNHRCLYCRKGKQPKRLFETPGYDSHPNFRPKSRGWKSLNNHSPSSE